MLARSQEVTMPQDTKSSAPNAPPPGEPRLQPHPRLLAALSIAFVLWMVALLTLYFQTVYPRRHPAPTAMPTPATSESIPTR
jgi:hypothetical protein